jgi:hypothetical protein
LLLPEKPSRLRNGAEVAEIVRKISTKKLGSRVKVDVVELSVDSVEKLLSKSCRAKMLVGMTDSSMIAALFLPKHSGVVEMFPFGLGPDVSSFIQVTNEQDTSTLNISKKFLPNFGKDIKSKYKSSLFQM